MTDQQASALSGPSSGLAPLRVSRGPDETAKLLVQAGRRGRLPGLRREGEGRFALDSDGRPFEHDLVLTLQSDEGGTGVLFALRRRRVLPLVFAAVLALTVWPGVWLTDSLLGLYWAAYGRWSQQMSWLTYAWYLPTTVLPLPWLWRSLVRRSREEAQAEAAKLSRVVGQVLGADGAA